MSKDGHQLDRILNPSSVALIGASKDPMKWGHMLLSNIIKGGTYYLQEHIMEMPMEKIKHLE